MIIIVTGTPGTGKTVISKKLAKAYNHKFIDVKALLEKSTICEGFDEQNECLIIDPKKLAKMLIDLINKNNRLIIDSHLSHYIPQKYIDLCVVCKCEISELKKRLKERGYKDKKIRDNLDAEIFDVCLYLRKKLLGARIRKLEQKGFERIVEIEIEKQEGKLSLFIELFGKGNIILVKDNKILSAVEQQKWADRSVMPGNDYIFPNKPINFLKMDEEQFRELD